MKFKIEIHPYLLHFKNPAGTSRGVYHSREVWYVVVRSLEDSAVYGIGECAPLLDLSCDNLPDYEEVLRGFASRIEAQGYLDTELLRNYPSMLFGFETAFRQYEQKGSVRLWDNSFSNGERGITINGLIWMGSRQEMYDQIVAKLEQGFHCIKLKIGAINFEEEISLLKFIREQFSIRDIELRVDANGAFDVSEAKEKLKQLSEFEIHSIEQPIRAGQWKAMAELCRDTPVAIALDEELIGVNERDMKQKLLCAIAPQYIILKPSLHGGLSGCSEWTEIAESFSVPWWITSALESNIGLNAIAQWTANHELHLPQGLGTGMLYTNNIDFPLSIKGDQLWFSPDDYRKPEFMKL
ncbi:MAG: o-succinylbenzoate synthase [Bacteroidales bacterium]